MKDKESEIQQTRELMTETEALLCTSERALFASFQLCASDLAILKRLQKKGPKPVNQLAAKVGLTSGSMTTATQRLRKRELITTTRDQKDGRKVWVAISKTGKQTLKELSSEREKLLSPIFTNLSSRERQVLTGLLKKVRKASQTKN